MREESIETWNGGEAASVGVTCEDVTMDNEQSLRAKLRGLRITRAELDRDILLLEKALRIMSGTHP
jgi:hypothetical protein